MIDTLYFTALVLVSIRMFCFFIMLPIFFPSGTPNTVKVGLTLVMAYILLPGIDYSTVNTIDSTIPFIYNCVNEAAAGFTLGFMVSLCFTAFRIAGSYMDLQIGLAMMSMFDPNSESTSTLMERLMYWFVMVVFLAVDGHHMLIKSLLDSFSTIRLGSFLLTQGSVNIVIKAFITYFSIAVKIAVPILLIMLMADLTMSLVARTVPQLNVMILGLPIKILLGMASFCFALPLFFQIMEKTFYAIPDSIRGFYNTLPLIMIFASDDKTEEATPRKKSDARKKGQIPKSKEVSMALTLLVSALVMLIWGGYVGSQAKSTMAAFLNSYLSVSLNYESLKGIAFITMWRLGAMLLPVVLPILIIGVMANLLQTRGLVTAQTLKPDFSKLNPINGFKRMFSMRAFMELFKDTVVIIIVGFIGYKFIKDNYTYIMTLSDLNFEGVARAVLKLTVDIFFRVTLVMIIIAIIDYIFQNFQYKKDLKMSKQEVKEEYKQDEGDPQIKNKIKQKQREIGMRRMMQEVPKATVVVTNPTHVAVALKYEDGKNDAPVVVAKGLDAVAFRIKKVAAENDVPVIENRPLARLIYEEVDIDMEIPAEMYQAVAEILALVYKMR
ncbi:fused FliR family export protein/FlhB family type III secretion system protein [Clostridium luticellarii]|uniref:Flagellar biosynthetic protein FliR n=1 Tax=Clostridium luticellarii TaxID=1691940 RepID=A0A2T0BRY0_9CLOT|nr:fused FliR family export protein/FlhB family type III secretion system protein [Clostridium luticellarii]MCI1943685.1 fused FliR family export protein/FlhB family type III secretion system protein [Clostridium luticellarii]MCI1968936.1 fused FliR family export protein/FlhB family type III secretion system protein [Clostridium luticellarii]MCI1994313.1 fused FliR family export protein/FlhB family type III secretion system protein [Clostridium luticellarii]MCI2038734.1 fused FliR family export